MAAPVVSSAPAARAVIVALPAPVVTGCAIESGPAVSSRTRAPPFVRIPLTERTAVTERPETFVLTKLIEGVAAPMYVAARFETATTRFTSLPARTSRLSASSVDAPEMVPVVASSSVEPGSVMPAATVMAPECATPPRTSVPSTVFNSASVRPRTPAASAPPSAICVAAPSGRKVTRSVAVEPIVPPERAMRSAVMAMFESAPSMAPAECVKGRSAVVTPRVTPEGPVTAWPMESASELDTVTVVSAERSPALVVVPALTMSTAPLVACAVTFTFPAFEMKTPAPEVARASSRVVAAVRIGTPEAPTAVVVAGVEVPSLSVAALRVPAVLSIVPTALSSSEPAPPTLTSPPTLRSPPESTRTAPSATCWSRVKSATPMVTAPGVPR